MEANEPLIVQLQAHWRGGLVRRPFQKRLAYLRDHKDQAVTLQAHWKGYRQRKEYSERLEFLKKQAAIAVKVKGSLFSYNIVYIGFIQRQKFGKIKFSEGSFKIILCC